MHCFYADYVLHLYHSIVSIDSITVKQNRQFSTYKNKITCINYVSLFMKHMNVDVVTGS